MTSKFVISVLFLITLFGGNSNSAKSPAKSPPTLAPTTTTTLPPPIYDNYPDYGDYPDYPEYPYEYPFDPEYPYEYPNYPEYPEGAYPDGELPPINYPDGELPPFDYTDYPEYPEDYPEYPDYPDYPDYISTEPPTTTTTKKITTTTTKLTTTFKPATTTLKPTTTTLKPTTTTLKPTTTTLKPTTTTLKPTTTTPARKTTIPPQTKPPLTTTTKKPLPTKSTSFPKWFTQKPQILTTPHQKIVTVTFNRGGFVQTTNQPKVIQHPKEIIQDFGICDEIVQLMDSKTYLKSICVVKQKMNYDNANWTCVDNGMDLFAINSIDVNIPFRRIANLQWWQDSEQSYWMNGRRSIDNGMWYIFTLRNGYERKLLHLGVQFHWPSSGDCLRYWKPKDGRWNANGCKCESESFVLCEFF